MSPWVAGSLVAVAVGLVAGRSWHRWRSHDEVRRGQLPERSAIVFAVVLFAVAGAVALFT